MFVDKPTCYIKPFFGRYVFVRGDYQEIFSIRSDGFTLRERAICTMLTRPIFRTPRSTAPTYVRWSPQASASSSCDHPTCLRKVRMRSPNFFWILTHANTILNMLPMSLQTISSIYFKTSFWLCPFEPGKNEVVTSRRQNIGIERDLYRGREAILKHKQSGI